MSSAGAPQEAPALLTRMSMEPSFSRAWETANAVGGEAFGAERIDGGGEPFFAAGYEKDGGASFAEAFGHLLTESAGSAGDEGDLALEVEQRSERLHGREVSIA
jgi:hypothetical protein